MGQDKLVVITRPNDDARDFLEQVTVAGFSGLLAPMLDIIPQTFSVPDLCGYQGVIFTSARAVCLFSASTDVRDVPIFVVGSRTEDVAKGCGFLTVHCANGSGLDLADLIMETAHCGDDPFLHVRGRHVAVSIDDLISSAGIQVDHLVVYDAQAIESLDAEVLRVFHEKRVEAVTFFSRRTAQNFMSLVEKNNLGDLLFATKVLCISEAVLECVRSYRWADAYVSDRPNGPGMLALLKRVCS